MTFCAVTFARFSFDPAPPANLAAEKLNVVILYERLGYVSKAVATYLQLTRDLGDEFSPDFRLWRIDLTLEPAFTAEAERDFADADVIIVAAHGRQRCPPEFQRWKYGVGHGGGLAPHAVIALMDGSDEPAPAAESWGGLLHDSATQIHAEVFVCDLAERRREIRPPPLAWSGHERPEPAGRKYHAGIAVAAEPA